MAKQTFTAGQVLTAAQMNNLQTDIFNQTTSTKTANYSLVVGDRGTRVIGNGTSITFTVDNNIFTAGDTIKIHNINSTVLTIAAGAGVTINAAAGLTMSQYQEATLFATSASSFILFESSASSAQGLTLLNTTSFSGVSSQSINDVFSATYENYRIHFANLTNTSSGDIRLRWRVSGADNTTTNYRYAGIQNGTDSTSTGIGATGQTSIRIGYFTTGRRNFLTGIDVLTPFASNMTGTFNSAFDESSPNAFSTITTSVFAADTSFTGFTIFPASGNISGSVSVYGYNK